jgi:hypothetical protein
MDSCSGHRDIHMSIHCQQQQEVSSPTWFDWIQNRFYQCQKCYQTLFLGGWKSLSACYLCPCSKVSTTMITTTTTTNHHPRFCNGNDFINGGGCRCCRRRCRRCSLVDVKTSSQVDTKTKTSSQRNNSSICSYKSRSTTKQSFRCILVMVLLLLADWKSLEITVAAHYADTADSYGNDYFYPPSILHNQPSVITSLLKKGGEQIPVSASTISNSSSNTNSSSTSPSTNTRSKKDYIVPTSSTRRGTIPSSNSRPSSSKTTTTKTSTPITTSHSLPTGRPIPSSAIRSRYHSPVSYQYFARKHVHPKHSTIQQQKQQSQDTTHFIIVGPNVDHWKEVGPMLASRGFNVMVCERVEEDEAEDEAEEGGGRQDQQSVPGIARGDDQRRPPHHHHYLQQDSPELVLRIMGTSVFEIFQERC